jgi:hypothetical protein
MAQWGGDIVESSTYPSGTAGGAGTPLKEQVRETAQQAKEQTQQAAGQAMEKARTQIKSGLTSQKDRVAEGADSVAQALRSTGEQLNEKDQGMVGQYAFQAADMVENVAGYFREHDIDQLMGEAENFARRQPAIFLGGAFALGFCIARFMKSSSGQAGGWRGDGMQAGGMQGYGMRDRESYGAAQGFESRPYAASYQPGAGAPTAGATMAGGTASGGFGAATLEDETYEGEDASLSYATGAGSEERT